MIDLNKLMVHFISALYGALMHALLLMAYIHWAYKYPPPPEINHQLVWIGMIGFGGLYASLLLPRLALKNRSRPSGAVRGGLLGILVTLLTCATVGFLATLYVTAYFRSNAQFVEPLIRTFFVTLPGVVTICMISFGHSIPFDFTYGAIAGICFTWLNEHKDDVLGRRLSV